MIPSHRTSLGLLGAMLGGIGLLHSDGLTKEQRQLRRLDAAERRALEIAAKRAASPAVAAAERKRARRAAKLRELAH